MPGFFEPADREAILEHLRQAARQIYGPERAAELDGELIGIGGAMARVVAKRLDYQAAPPPIGV